MLPFNIFDQRPIQTKILEKLDRLKIEIHSRSTFLQGLLMMNYDNLPTRFNRWIKKFENFDKLSKKLRLKKYQICLRYVLSNPYIDKVVVGTNNFNQFKELVSTRGVLYPNINNLNSSKEINLINPSKWPNIRKGIKE